MQEHVLLDFVDALVRADEAPTGFRGQVALGIRGASETKWWHADFGARKVTSFSDAMPERFDVAVGLDADTAAYALGIADDPGSLHVITGDKRLWDRFLSRYVQHTNLLALRAKGNN